MTQTTSNLHNPDQVSQVLSDTVPQNSVEVEVEVVKPTQTYSPNSSFDNLKPEHQAHILERGLKPEWGAASCISCDIPKGTLMLGYKAQSPGIMLMSAEYGLYQLRPDNPWPSKDGTIPKYRSLADDYDIFLPQHPTNRDFWKDLDALKEVCIKINGKPYLLLTEGGFKAIMGCQNDIPTVAVAGVEMGLTPKRKGDRDLVPGLKRLAEAGFGFIIPFDSDDPVKKPETVKNVRRAEAKLTKVLESYGCDVLSVTGKWNHEDGKGMDDFIQNKGIEAFKKILMKAESHSEPIASGDSPAKVKKPPTPRQIAAEIAEEYGSQWKFDNEQKTWRIWTGREWEKIEIGNFETLLQTVIDARNIEYTGDAFLTDVLKLLTKRLRVARWQVLDRKRYTNFSNCVLDADNFRILEHSPGMGFTSHLPYEYKPLAGEIGDALEALKANCPNIYNWLTTAMQGSAKKMLKILAIINGALRFRFHDLQMFVHFVGKPGSGKGTAARLIEKVVGYANFAACQLDKLKDGSTVASIIDKQLVVFGDERKPVGIDSILSFTGGDAISYREVYRPAANAFFYGLMLICSNKPIFVGDTTGLERRLCLLHFDNPIPTERRNYSMEKDFDGEIAALIAIALTIPDSLVTQTIQGTGESQIAEFKAKEWEMKYQTDSIAAYFNDRLVLTGDPNTNIKTSDLYSNYRFFCEMGGMQPKSVVKFPEMLRDLCTELGFPEVVWERKRGRSSFYGVRMRDDEKDDIPTYSETLSPMTGVESENDGGLTGVVRGLKPASVGSCGGFDQKMAKLSENLETPKNLSEKTEDLSEINSFTPPKPPSNAATPNPQGIQPPSNPRQTPVIDSQPPSSETATALADEMREAIAKCSREDARKIIERVIESEAQVKESFAKAFSKEENMSIRLLKHCGWVAGTRVKYVGTKYSEQFEGMELVVDSIDKYSEIICTKPDGRFTSGLKPEDLIRL